MTSNNKPKDPDSILRSRFNKTKEEIEKLSLSEKWKIIYSAPKKGRDNRDPIPVLQVLIQIRKKKTS